MDALGIFVTSAILVVVLALEIKVCRWGARRVDAWVPERAFDMTLMVAGSILLMSGLMVSAALSDFREYWVILVLSPLFASLMGATMVLAMYINFAIIDSRGGRIYYDAGERVEHVVARLAFRDLADAFLDRMHSGWIPLQSLFTPINVLRERSTGTPK